MAQTTLNAPNTAAWTTADIVVTAATPTTATVYSDVEVTANFQVSLEQKTPAGYQPVEIDGKSRVILNRNQRQFLLTMPGSYRLVKQVTPQALGACIDQ